jgi:hypothetical protein
LDSDEIEARKFWREEKGRKDPVARIILITAATTDVGTAPDGDQIGFRLQKNVPTEAGDVRKRDPRKPDENPIRNDGTVIVPVNFTHSRPDFPLPLTSEILPALKNRHVISGGHLAFCLLPTPRYE